MDINKHISNLVESQFPAFYKSDGPDFINFVKHYYEFLEETDNILDKGRSFLEIKDIDDTRDEFVKYFVKKYMTHVPEKVLGDKRFLQKHILDLYRSKGSIEGLKLLFRLLYNEEIDVYIPSYDMLKPSDGKWVRKEYLEVAYNANNHLYEGKYIKGLESQAMAIVEKYEVRNIENKDVYVFFLSNIMGQFRNGEKVVPVDDSIAVVDSTSIIGSVEAFNSIGSDIDNLVGDVYSSTDDRGLKAIVNGIEERAGIIKFEIVDGGYGYTLDPVISITAGGNTTGSGANFEVASLSNTSTYVNEDTIIEPYTGISIDASVYASSNTDNTGMSTANLSSVIDTALNFSSFTIGSIATLKLLNPGENYNGDVTITITEPEVLRSSIPDGKGGIWGENANVTGSASFGSGVVSSLRLVDSGFGYYTTNGTVSFINERDNTKTITADVTLGSKGIAEGYWQNDDGRLNVKKYIQDSYFYQEFSYQIKSSKSFDKYVKVLRQLMHPAGNEPFGRSITVANKSTGISISEQVVKRVPAVWNDGDNWYDTNTWSDYENTIY